MEKRHLLEEINVLEHLRDAGYADYITSALATYGTTGTGDFPDLLRRILGHSVPGFRDPLKAPASLIAASLQKSATSSDEVFKVLVLVWLEQVDEVVHAVRDFITANAVPEMEGVDEIAARLHEDRPSLAVDDIRIVLSCAVGGLIPQSEPEETPAVSNSRTDDGEGPALRAREILNALPGLLRSLDSQDEVWSLVSECAQELLEIAAAKQDEASELEEDRLRRVVVDESIASLGDVEDTLQDLLLSYASWGAMHCSEDRLDDAGEKLKRLRDLLGEYASTEARKPANFEELETRARCLIDLQRLVGPLYRELNVLLSAELRPGTAPAEVEPEEETVVEAKVEAEPEEEIPVETRAEAEPEEETVVEAKAETEPEEEIPVEAKAETEPEEEIPVEAKAETEPEEEIPVETKAEVEPEEETVVEAKAEVEPEEEIPVEAKAETEQDRTWSFVEQEDFAGIYWFAKALEVAQQVPPIPSWLASTMAGARWLVDGVLRDEAGVCAIVEEHALPDDRGIQAALCAITALIPALTHPNTNLRKWLRPLSHPFDAMNPVIDAVASLADNGLSLQRQDMGRMKDREVLNREATECARRVRDWLGDRAPVVTFFYSPATIIFRRLIAEGGSLEVLLQPVVNDCRSEVSRVAQALPEWESRNQLKDIVRREERAERIHSRRGGRKPVESRALQMLLDVIQQAAELARAWCDVCDRWRVQAEQKEWWAAQVKDFRHSLEETIPPAKLALNGSPAGIDAASRVICGHGARVIEELEAFASGLQRSSISQPVMGTSLSAGLATRLMWHPGLRLVADDEGFPMPLAGTYAEVRQRVAEENLTDISVNSVVEHWCEREDFRWLMGFLECAARDEALDSGQAVVWAALESSRRRLQSAVDELRGRLEEAFAEGTVLPDARAHLGALLEQAEQEARGVAARRDQGNTDIGARQRQLAQASVDIERHRDNALKEGRERWEQRRPKAAAVLPAPACQRLEQIVNKAIERPDIFQFNEIVAALDRSLADNAPDELLIFLTSAAAGADSSANKLRDFREAQLTLQGLLKDRGLTGLEQAVRRGQAPSAMEVRRLPSPRLEEVCQALAAWRHLKQQDDTTRGDGNDYSLFTILRYLGFQLRPDSAQSLNIESQGRGWSVWRASMSAEPVSPVPQFGSERGGRFTVVCLWERPGILKMDAIAKEVGIEDVPTVVVYLGSILPKQWDDMADYARREGRLALLLDEVLLIFLAREYELRLQAFFACTLPATAVNPYTPYAAGNVPREMFFGRRRLLRRLGEQLGPALVCGGRQLGKSSLLMQLRRESHDPDRQRFAFYADIRTIGGPGALAKPEVVWSRILEGLREMDLIRKGTSERPDLVQNAIRRIMAQDKNRRVLILLDEVDAFLAADSQQGFRVVSELKTIMDATGRRFKVVLAGLNRVDRYSYIPNQPLAHLGRPEVVGPLDPADGLELVCTPLQVLGFRFDDRAIPLRILSITNHHPGLVQLFCSKLVDNLRQRHRAATLPHTVEMADIDAIYRDPDFRKEMRNRFVWTLDLDDHYGVLVRAMIVDQMGQPNGFTTSYSLRELRDLGAYWWEQGFRHLHADQFRAYLLELEDLWVLARAEGGRYRLRSPSAVRLLGTAEDIEYYLEPYIDKEADTDPWAKVDLLHARIVTKPLTYSPLSNAQTGALGIGSTGVTTVFGSAALGLDSVSQTIQALSDLETSRPFRHEHVGEEMTDAAQVKHVLAKVTTGYSAGEGKVVSLNLSGSAEALLAQAREALRFCERGDWAADGWIRVVLLVGAEHFDEWFRIDHVEREQLEDRTSAIKLDRWRTEAVEQLLGDNEVPADSEAIKIIFEATGGYHFLLSEFVGRWSQSRKQAPTELAQSLLRSLSETDSDLNRRFRVAMGLPTSRLASDAFRSLCGFMDTTASEIRDDVLELMDDMPEEEREAGLLVLERMALIECTDDQLNMLQLPLRVLA